MIKSDKNIVYYNSNLFDVKNGGVSAWQGIRTIDSDSDVYLICGTTFPNPQNGSGIVFIGNLSFTSGVTYILNVPHSKYTSVYGPNYDKSTGIFNFVGSYTANTTSKGYIYTGKLTNDALGKITNYTYPSVNYTFETVFVHSISNNFYVGNAGNSQTKDTLSFLYNTSDNNKMTTIMHPYAKTTTTYGIWYIGKNIYIIVGGYSKNSIAINDIYDRNNMPISIGENYFAFYDSVENIIFDWTTLILPVKNVLLSHIEGVSGYFDCKNTFSLSLDVIDTESHHLGCYAVIALDNSSNYKIKKFVQVNYDDNANGISSSNSVADNNIVGLYESLDLKQSFQAKIEF